MPATRCVVALNRCAGPVVPSHDQGFSRSPAAPPLFMPLRSPQTSSGPYAVATIVHFVRAPSSLDLRLRERVRCRRDDPRFWAVLLDGATAARAYQWVTQLCTGATAWPLSCECRSTSIPKFELDAGVRRAHFSRMLSACMTLLPQAHASLQRRRRLRCTAHGLRALEDARLPSLHIACLTCTVSGGRVGAGDGPRLS